MMTAAVGIDTGLKGRVVLLPMRAEVLKGHLDGLLLATLAAGPRHGYAVKQALRAGSGGRIDLPTGTVYPALHRLERAGLIGGSWSVVDGRRRRSYQLTPAGRRALNHERASWQEFSAAVSALLGGTPWPAAT
jgi:PadR family transcriptional regulator, regulatory protein PadR